MIVVIVVLVSTFLSSLLTGRIRRLALQRNMMDLPNERSSHTQPTPRGGGLSIVLIVLAGVLILGMAGLIPARIALAFLMGSIVAFIGWRDDRGGLPPLTRAVVQTGAAAAAVALLGGVPVLDLGFAVIEWGWAGHLIGIIGIVWMTNLFNFMDGIDGLAASEAVFVFGVGGILLAVTGLSPIVLVCALYAGGSLGFLRWNWPPARIFLGDVASGFLGFSIGAMAIAAAEGGFPLWVWLILAGVFVCDATVTLIRRMARGERWYHPHRSHAYQHLTRRWNSHRRVTVGVIAINLIWLTPIAYLCLRFSEWAPLMTIIALLPLVAVALRLGAGVSDAAPQDPHDTDTLTGNSTIH